MWHCPDRSACLISRVLETASKQQKEIELFLYCAVPVLAGAFSRHDLEQRYFPSPLSHSSFMSCMFWEELPMYAAARRNERF